MGTFYWSTFQSPYFFTFTWVKKFSQYFFLNTSICTSTWVKDVCTFATSGNDHHYRAITAQLIHDKGSALVALGTVKQRKDILLKHAPVSWSCTGVGDLVISVGTDRTLCETSFVDALAKLRKIVQLHANNSEIMI